ncbi:hypothetical protein K438DRAFT_1867380, partial [Mycena galopus ATCC 62051]
TTASTCALRRDGIATALVGRDGGVRPNHPNDHFPHHRISHRTTHCIVHYAVMLKYSSPRLS